MRDRLTRELISKKGFRFVAIEGDWPDAARVDHYVRHLEYPFSEWTAFARFPVWMWRNKEVSSFVDWLRNFNASDANLAIASLFMASTSTAFMIRSGQFCATSMKWIRARPASLGEIWMPHSMAVGSGHVRPCCTDRNLSDL